MHATASIQFPAIIDDNETGYMQMQQIAAGTTATGDKRRWHKFLPYRLITNEKYMDSLHLLHYILMC